MYAVGQAVDECAGEAVVTEHFGPWLEGEFAGHETALPFRGAAEDFVGELGPGLGEGYMAEFVENEHVLFPHAFEQAFQLGCFEQLGDRAVTEKQRTSLPWVSAACPSAVTMLFLPVPGLLER